MAAEERTFRLNDSDIVLEDVSAEVDVFYRSMRFNRVQNVWNAEVVLRNRATRNIAAPLVLSIESFSGTTGPLQTDGQAGTPLRPFFDLSSTAISGELAPGQSTAARTIQLGRSAGSPTLVTRVFAARDLGGYALGYVRSLDALGHPLAGVEVEVRGSGANETNRTDQSTGLMTFGRSAGAHRLLFRKTGYLPVWRDALLLRNRVETLSPPRLTWRSAQLTQLTAQNGGVLSDANNGIQIRFGGGSFANTTEGTLTPVNPQSLPAFLPKGWTPLQAFWFEAGLEPTRPGECGLVLWEQVPPTNELAFVRWDAGQLRWRVALAQSGSSNHFSGPVDASGAYAVLLADAGAGAPPRAVTGEFVQGTTTPGPNPGAVTATGIIQPELAAASKDADLVTALAEVTFTNALGGLQSGTTFRCEVQERYVMRDGTVRVTPRYEQDILAHRPVGERLGSTLKARFPVRPLLLHEPAELVEATLRVDVLLPRQFAGQIIDAAGGRLSSGNVSIEIPTNGLDRVEAIELRSLDTEPFASLLPDGTNVVVAFDLRVAGARARIALQAVDLPTNSFFVLGRVLSRDGVYGIEPVERLRSDNSGGLVSMEPATGEALGGIRTAGQFVLVRVAAAEGLIAGNASNGAGNVTESMIIQAARWVTASGANGRYRILGPSGTNLVTLADPITGERTISQAVVPGANAVVQSNLRIAAAAPRVISITPGAGSTNVPHVTAIIIEFSEPLARESVSTNEIRLIGSSNQVVVAMVTLSQDNSTARLLPTEVLAPSTLHRVILSDQIRDLTGAPLAGEREFTFTTATDLLDRPPGAQLISHEPKNGEVELEGTQGMADPDTPVILVNDTTGETATTRSLLDGSFTGKIAAGVDDRLRAVFVNQNGTRSEIPVGRQVFADGSVGLYSGGGSITNSNDELRVVMEVPPGVISGRTQFKIDPLKLSDLPTLTSNTPPLDATPFGILDLKMSGDPVRGRVKVTFQPSAPVPTNGALFVSSLREFEEFDVGGPRKVLAYKYLGLLERTSVVQTLSQNQLRAAGIFPAMFSLIDPEQARILLVGEPYYDKTELLGLVVSAIGQGGLSFDEDTDVALPGAVVRARARSVAQTRPFTLQHGETVTVSDDNGVYRFLVPAQPQGGHSLNATHPLFPGQIAGSGAGTRFNPSHPYGGGKIIFDRRAPPDRDPPAISMIHNPTVPQAGEVVTLRVSATDSSGPPNLILTPDSYTPVTGNLRVFPDGAGQWTITFSEKGKVVMKAIATDAFGNRREQIYPIQFGQPEPVGTLANDPVGPRVIFSQPDENSVGVPTAASIFLQFNEPMGDALTNAPVTYLTLSPPAGDPRVRFARDRSEVTVNYARLRPNTEYTLMVLGALDANGQIFDQDPDPASPAAELFTLRFRTASEINAELLGILDGRGTVVRGAFAYVADRAEHELVAFDISVPSRPVEVTALIMPGPPQSLAIIPDYSFATNFGTAQPSATPPARPELSDLLALAGKATAGGYLRIYDIRKPLTPGSHIATGLIDMDETAVITKLAWSAPYLVAIQNSLNSPSIRVLNAQTFLLGDEYRRYVANFPLSIHDSNIFPEFSIPGVDANGDGDFVDSGDQLPRVGQDLFDFIAGEEDILTLNANRLGAGGGPIFVNASSRFITDVVVHGPSGFVGALVSGGRDIEVEYDIGGRPISTNPVVKPASLRGMAVGQLLPDTNRVEFPGFYPKRALPFTLSGRRYALVNLISLDNSANRLVVVDVTRPEAIVTTNEIPFPRLEFGLLQGAEFTGAGQIALSTVADSGEHQYILLDPARLLDPQQFLQTHSSILGSIRGVGGSVTPFFIGRHGTIATSLRNQNFVAQISPSVRLVRANDQWYDPFRLNNFADRLEEIRARPEPDFLAAVRHTATSTNLIPGTPDAHYHLLAEVPGGAGTEISLAVLSLDVSNRLVFRASNALPPALLADVRLRRLSDDPRREAYNVYLSQPIALVAQDLTASEISQANATHPRHLLYAGQRLRVGFSNAMIGNPVLQPFAGIGALSAATNAALPRLGVSLARPVVDLLRLVADDMVVIETGVDLLNTNSCPGSAMLHFENLPECKLTLRIDGQVVRNVTDDTGRMIQSFQDVAFTAGSHWVILDAGHAGAPGDHSFELRGREFGGLPPDVEAVETGIVRHEIDINHSFPIGHTIVQGVDIWDGHLTHSRQDVLVPGRRLSLDFSRSYSSQGNSSDGPIGAGWTHSYNIRVVERCGVFTVIGGEGSGNAFHSPAVNAALAARYANFLPVAHTRFEFFKPQIGYHSTLARDTGRPNDLWFFTKAAVRYHFIHEPRLSTPSARVFTAREIREPNGNAIGLKYDVDSDLTTLDTVTELDALGAIPKRGFSFEYARINNATRITLLRGFNQQTGGDLLGLEIQYRYDEWGNLTNVVRVGATANDTRTEDYIYSPGNGITGHNLLAYIDPNGAVTTNEFGAPGLLGYFQVGIPLNDIPAHEVVRSVTRVGTARPGFAATANSVTRFRYDWPTYKRFVSDPRPADGDGNPISETEYGVNLYGATTNIVAPLGQTTVMRWATDHLDGSVKNEAQQNAHDVLMTYKRDAEGQEHFYEYHDGRGNLTREIVRVSPTKEPIYSAAGTRVTEVMSQGSFDTLFNARTNNVDAEGSTTSSLIDPANGNLRFLVDAEGNTTEMLYKSNGDLEKRIDPRGFVTEFARYDLYGNAELTRAEVERGGRVIETTNIYDERSRLEDSRDTFTHHSHYAYDSLDRRVREERLNSLSGTGPDAVKLTLYLAGGEIASTTNELGLVTTFEYDSRNRKVRSQQLNVLQPAGPAVTYTNLTGYDMAGNVIAETDGRGVERIHFYDALNRRLRTEMNGPHGGPFKPDRVISRFVYDKLNNVQTETDLHGFVTTHIQDGLYRNVETRLAFPGAVISSRYDRVGNKLLTTDANGNPSEFRYDRVYRLVYTKDAEGNETEFRYDRSSNRTNTINLSSGLGLVSIFDGLNRPIETTQTGPGLPAGGYLTKNIFIDSRNEVVVENPRRFKTRTRKDSLDRLAESVVDDAGLNLATRFTHDAAGNVLTVIDPQNGDVDVTNTYDQLSRRFQTEYVRTPSDGLRPVFETIAYDPGGNPVHTRDKRGFEQRLAFDNLNRARTTELKEDISNGGTWLMLSESVYDDQAYTMTSFDARRNPTITEHDELGRLKKVTDVLGQTVSMTYDAINKVSTTDKKGQRLVFTHDRLNRLKTTTEFDTNNLPQTSTAIVYLDRGRQQLIIDRRSLTNRISFDALGRTILTERMGGDLASRYGADPLTIERREYDGNNNLETVIDADGRIVKHEYDGADRKTATIAGFGSPVAGRTTYLYNNVGRLLESKDARTHIATYDVKNSYDARYRLTNTVNALGEPASFEYDAANNLTKTTEPLGFSTQYEYDELNILLAVDETPRLSAGDAGVTRFRYDANRSKIAQQDASSNLVTYSYDRLNRLTNTLQHTLPGTITSGGNRAGPFGGGNPLSWSYEYDANNNQSRITDARGQQADLSYDHLNRLALRTYSKHAETNAFGGLINFQPINHSFAYDGNGNPTNNTEAKQLNGNQITERTTMAYDALNRLTTRTRFDYDDAAGRELAFEYDRAGNRTRIEDPDGRVTQYAFDERNRLLTTTLDSGGTALTATNTWEADSLLQRIDFPGGSFALRSYDLADRLLGIRNAHTNGTVFSTYDYAYDRNGNRTNQIELQPALSALSESTSYTYDKLNRLTRVSYGSGSFLDYTYAPNGNRLTERGADPLTGAPVDRIFHYTQQAGSATTTFSGVNSLTRIQDNTAAAAHVDYDYDRNLNQIGRTQGNVRSEFRFDIRDQMIVALTPGSALQFDYNFERLRIKKGDIDPPAGAPPETRYLYDQSSVLIEYGPVTAGHRTQQKYDYGSDLLAFGIANALGALERRFYLKDALRSTANLVTTNGLPANSYRYDAWGRLRAKTGSDENRRQFTGHYRDAETGLHYFGARYYDDEQARFLSQDPYLGTADTPPSLHRYLYAYANPLRYVDLTGYQSEESGAPGGPRLSEPSQTIASGDEPGGPKTTTPAELEGEPGGPKSSGEEIKPQKRVRPRSAGKKQTVRPPATQITSDPTSEKRRRVYLLAEVVVVAENSNDAERAEGYYTDYESYLDAYIEKVNSSTTTDEIKALGPPMWAHAVGGENPPSALRALDAVDARVSALEGKRPAGTVYLKGVITFKYPGKNVSGLSPETAKGRFSVGGEAGTRRHLKGDIALGYEQELFTIDSKLPLPSKLFFPKTEDAKGIRVGGGKMDVPIKIKIIHDTSVLTGKSKVTGVIETPFGEIRPSAKHDLFSFGLQGADFDMAESGAIELRAPSIRYAERSSVRFLRGSSWVDDPKEKGYDKPAFEIVPFAAGSFDRPKLEGGMLLKAKHESGWEIEVKVSAGIQGISAEEVEQVLFGPGFWPGQGTKYFPAQK